MVRVSSPQADAGEARRRKPAPRPPTATAVPIHDVRKYRSAMASSDVAQVAAPAARMVAFVLADCMNPDGSGCYPSLMPKDEPDGRSLVERTGLKPRALLGHLRDLCDGGLLLQIGHGHRGRNAEYAPALPEWWFGSGEVPAPRRRVHNDDSRRPSAGEAERVHNDDSVHNDDAQAAQRRTDREREPVVVVHPTPYAEYPERLSEEGSSRGEGHAREAGDQADPTGTDPTGTSPDPDGDGGWPPVAAPGSRSAHHVDRVDQVDDEPECAICSEPVDVVRVVAGWDTCDPCSVQFDPLSWWERKRPAHGQAAR